MQLSRFVTATKTCPNNEVGYFGENFVHSYFCKLSNFTK